MRENRTPARNLSLFHTVIDSPAGRDGRHPQRKEKAMNWDRIEGNWKEFKGKVKQQWGKLTDDDLMSIEGGRDKLEGLLQQRYGYAKDKARQEIDSWLGGI
jgi:uncharacterized protein YjbJ (UPF0337 family)